MQRSTSFGVGERHVDALVVRTHDFPPDSKDFLLELYPGIVRNTVGCDMISGESTNRVRPQSDWTPEDCARFVAHRDIKFLAGLARNKAALRAARRLHLFDRPRTHSPLKS